MTTRKCNSRQRTEQNWLRCSCKPRYQCKFTFYQMFLLTYSRYSFIPTAINSLTYRDLFLLARILLLHQPYMRTMSRSPSAVNWQLVDATSWRTHCTWGCIFKWIWVAKKTLLICEAITSTVLSLNCCFLCICGICLQSTQLFYSVVKY